METTLTTTVLSLFEISSNVIDKLSLKSKSYDTTDPQNVQAPIKAMGSCGDFSCSGTCTSSCVGGND